MHITVKIKILRLRIAQLDHILFQLKVFIQNVVNIVRFGSCNTLTYRKEKTERQARTQLQSPEISENLGKRGGGPVCSLKTNTVIANAIGKIWDYPSKILKKASVFRRQLQSSKMKYLLDTQYFLSGVYYIKRVSCSHPFRVDGGFQGNTYVSSIGVG